MGKRGTMVNRRMILDQSKDYEMSRSEIEKEKIEDYLLNASYVFEDERGTKWLIAVLHIAIDHAAHFYLNHMDEYESFQDSLYETVEIFMDNAYIVKDWATGNMDWSDVADFTQRESVASFTLADAWTNPKSVRVQTE